MLVRYLWLLDLQTEMAYLALFVAANEQDAKHVTATHSSRSLLWFSGLPLFQTRSAFQTQTKSQT